MASQITSLTIVCSTIYSGADQRKQQSSASLAFVRGIHRNNKANLGDLIAATGLVILIKLDSNHRFSARVTLKFNG